MPWAQTLRDLSPHLSLHTSACALVSACCSFLSSFSQLVSHGTRDPLHTCPALPLTHPLTCMRIHRVHACRYGHREYSAVLTAAALDATFTLLLSALLGPDNPVCSRPCTKVCELGASTICALSLLDSEHCCWYITGSHRKRPDTHTCFLSTKITLRRAQWEFQADQPAALCLMRTNRECAGRVGALFFLSERGMNNSRACHNTPRVKFHIFTALP